MIKIKPGKYLHYKGKYYRVIGVGRHSETLEELVFYQKLDDGSWWIRPVKMFTELITIGGHKIPRFKYVEE